jgi:ribonuclease VapC
MIAVDTSVLMAVILGETDSEKWVRMLEIEPEILISAGTVAEALIVAGHRNVSQEMEALIDGLGLMVIPVTEATARRVAEAYRRWGKGVHPAALNFGDCFAYEIAMANNCRLLFTGNDFSKTDVARATS